MRQADILLPSPLDNNEINHGQHWGKREKLRTNIANRLGFDISYQKHTGTEIENLPLAAEDRIFPTAGIKRDTTDKKKVAAYHLTPFLHHSNSKPYLCAFVRY